MLVSRIAKQRGNFALDIEFTAGEGATTVLVGESGSGKTSVLRLLAGLDLPDRGSIAVGEAVYVDSVAGTAVPAWRRDVGYVPQDYALFPHLSVYQNVAFGLESLRLPKGEVRERADAALRLTGIPDLGRRMPAQLSGGQQQRAALARALALEPKLLLLDEPLSALDLQTRRAVRTELRDLLRRLPCITIYVTHSPVEALIFGDQIVVLERGRVSQAGSRNDLLRHPRSRFVAELMGTNLFIGKNVESDGSGTARVRTAEGDITVSGLPGQGDVFMTVNPKEITLYTQRPTSSAQNVFSGPILELIPEPPAGERVRVVIGTTPNLVAEVTQDAVATLGLREGLEVYAAFKATGVSVYV